MDSESRNFEDNYSGPESTLDRHSQTEDGVSRSLELELQARALSIRSLVLKMSYKAQTPHIGSSLSCVDILTACYLALEEDISDRGHALLLSKGHAAAGLYAALFEFGHLDSDTLDGFGQIGSMLEEHPNHFVPGIPHPSGSLGHGLGFAAGYVLSGTITGQKRRATVILSDGECNEGSVWEAALFAGGKSLNGITAIVDRNGLQATGKTVESYGQIDLESCFSSFGWETRVIDGHSPRHLLDALEDSRSSSAPFCIIADTTKGKGISFMEDDNNWHYKKLDIESLNRALGELRKAED